MARASRFAAVIVLFTGFVAGCHGSTQQTTEPMPGTVPSTPPGQGFGFFPNHPGRARCAIPEGGPAGPGRSVKGVCVTRVSGRPGYSGQTLVVFTETWPTEVEHRPDQGQVEDVAAASRRPQPGSRAPVRGSRAATPSRASPPIRAKLPLM